MSSISTSIARTRRARKRAARKAEHVARPPRTTAEVPEAIRARDPLVEQQSTLSKNAGRLLAVAIAAAVAHTLAAGIIFGAGKIARALSPIETKENVPIQVSMIEPPPPPEPEPEAEPEPEPEPEAKPEEKAPEKKPEKPAVPPPLDPIDQPPEPPKPADEPPARRVVGLSLESTVEGGGGPSFATGNTRMGQTAKKAEDPNAVAPAEKTVTPEPEKDTGNRSATRIPTLGAKIVKPERKQAVEPTYPETYRRQGIEADVVVRVSIDASGKVTGVVIVAPSSYAEFNDAAKEAALRETFSPATKDGVAISYTLTYTYRFRLNG